MNNEAKEYQLQGASMMGVGDYVKAKEYFLKALEEEKTAELYMDLGNATASLEEYEEAIEAFQKALMLEPDNNEVLFDIGSVYLLQGDIKRTMEYYNKAEEKGFKRVILYTNFAKIYKVLGDMQMVIRNYTKAIEANPLRGDLYVEKIKAFMDMKRYQDALNTLDDLKKVLPEAFEAYDLAAKIYTELGNTKMAETILEEGLARFPEDIPLRLSKVQLYIAIGDAKKAEDTLKEIKANPIATQYKRNIQMQEVAVASMQQKAEETIQLLEGVIEEEPEDKCDVEARYLMMMTAMVKKDYQKALDMAEVLAEQKEQNIFTVGSMYYKGELLQKLEREDEALVQYKKASKQLLEMCLNKRASYECYLFRSLCHKALKEYDKAIELAEFVSHLQPTRADGNMLLAEIYRDMGDEENSKKHFTLAKIVEPQYGKGN